MLGGGGAPTLATQTALSVYNYADSQQVWRVLKMAQGYITWHHSKPFSQEKVKDTF